MEGTARGEGPSIDVPMVDAIVEARRPSRWEARRLIGSLLVAYGILGFIVFVAGAILVSEPLDRLAEATSRLDQQRLLLARSLRTTSTTLGDAGAGLAGFDASIEQARGSTDRAAGLSRDVAATMAEVATSMRQITIFGTQPLANLAVGFERADDQLRQLGTDLDGIGTSLDRNAEDAATTRRGIDRLQGQIDLLADAVEGTSLGGLQGEAIEQLRLAIILIAAWLALLALGSLATGLFLIRPRR
jgi:methyl-accepting chemotaxis protein